jgi:hypothetical protein
MLRQRGLQEPIRFLKVSTRSQDDRKRGLEAGNFKLYRLARFMRHMLKGFDEELFGLVVVPIEPLKTARVAENFCAKRPPPSIESIVLHEELVVAAPRVMVTARLQAMGDLAERLGHAVVFVYIIRIDLSFSEFICIPCIVELAGSQESKAVPYMSLSNHERSESVIGTEQLLDHVVVFERLRNLPLDSERAGILQVPQYRLFDFFSALGFIGPDDGLEHRSLVRDLAQAYGSVDRIPFGSRDGYRRGSVYPEGCYGDADRYANAQH